MYHVSYARHGDTAYRAWSSMNDLNVVRNSTSHDLASINMPKASYSPSFHTTPGASIWSTPDALPPPTRFWRLPDEQSTRYAIDNNVTQRIAIF